MFQLSNQKGFTLLSSLIALTILITITPILILIIKMTTQIHTPYSLSDLELRQFHFFLSSEMNHAEKIQIKSNIIHIERDDGSKITIEKFNNLIRRRVDLSGNEILLRDVNQFLIEIVNDNLFSITIIRSDGHKYTKSYVY